MKIIYFPGFGGNQNSETYRKLIEKYKNSEIVIYDNINADYAFMEIQTQIQNYLSENLLLIGQSLGGFWAEHFAIKYDLNVILINPSLEPHESLKKYDLSDDNLRSFKKFKLKESSKKKTSIILSKNDTVVNPKPVLEKYKSLVDFKYVEGDHKLTEYETLFEEIEKMKF
ncbi:hypothetical protein NZ698_05365 [Chryseobacterium sp. PBS4-4]|uniref:Alpha/beta hydrolase n=1 Tax=Chryseobacterium edaphi TaxID=2976532 RepID=A0ABT2W319_9FLAO|nr:YqiA/YcfP family alpha/beta fold hydrolase [Chryseobacterium edaphi]MCU7616618.1 hypothetical protein [Chryseobacterium edaphi]